MDLLIKLNFNNISLVKLQTGRSILTIVIILYKPLLLHHTMPRFTIIDAPSILGLKSTGVEDLPEALKRAGLYEKLGAEYAGHVKPSSPYSPKRDNKTLLT